MSGHIVPWCLGCGLEEHDPVLFDVTTGNLLFDDVAFDIGVIANRLKGDFTMAALGAYFGYERTSIHKKLSRGQIAEPEKRTADGSHLWTAEQVARVIYYKQLPPPAEIAPCGTSAAYARHVRRGEMIDLACREAGNKARRAYKKKVRERVTAAS